MNKLNKIFLFIILIFSIAIAILSIGVVIASYNFANIKQEIGVAYEKYKNSEELYINACKYKEELEAQLENVNKNETR